MRKKSDWNTKLVIKFMMLMLALFITLAPSALAQEFGGTLVLAAETVGEAVEPGRFTGFGSTNILDNVYEGLTRPNDDWNGEPQPGLAESWEISEDELIYTFKLREGVTFHDGTPLDANAVARSLTRFRNEDDPSFSPGINAPEGSGNWESITAVDDMTVELVLKRPNVTQLFQLFHPDSYIISPTALDQFGTDIGTNPVGTGPFKVERLIPGQEAVLIANEEYWGGRPFLDTVIVRALPDPGTMLAAIEAGEANFAPYAPESAIPRLSEKDELTVLPGPPQTDIFIGANALIEPTNNRDIRLAINYAINRENIILGALNGLGEPPATIITPVEVGFDPSGREISQQNLELARQHIEASGLETPIPIELTFENNRFWPLMAELIKADLEAVGFDVTLDRLDTGSFWGKVLDGRAQLSLTQRSAWVPDPNNKALLLHSSFITAQKQTGNTLYPIVDELDALIEKGVEESDPSARAEIYREFQSLVLEWMPYITLAYYTKPLVMADNIRNVPIGGATTERIFLHKVWIDRNE